MKIAIELFASLFILIVTVAICVGVISSDLTVMDARDYYQSCVNQLQESNFADRVIDACIEDAAKEGYSIHISIQESPEGERSAWVTMKYKYKIIPLGISQEKTIEGYVN